MSGFVDEDPDDVGYIWRTGKRRQNESESGGKSKWDIPAHGGFPDGFLADVRVPHSIKVFNRILPPAEQKVISLAARYAFDGLDKYAEKTRVYANYDNLKHRPDADCASGIV